MINECTNCYCIGTHVAGIIVTNTTGITDPKFVPYKHFLGVAPDVTLGACNFIYLSLWMNLHERVFMN